MADPRTNTTAEQAVVRHIAADVGVVDELIRRGITRRWFNDPLYASVVEAAVRLRMSQREIEPLAIMSFSTNGVSPERWQELLAIWKDPRPPGKWETFLEPLQASVTLRDFDAVMADAGDYRTKHPEDVDRWLPIVASSLSGIVESGRLYDPRPSSHMREDMRKVIATTGIPHMDRFMKGGIWDAALILWGGISNHGKSTLAYTLAARLVQQGVRIAFVTTETLPVEVTIGVVRILAGLSDTRVRQRDPRCEPYIEQADSCMVVYDWRFSDIPSLDRMLHWERPSVLIYDFLKAPEGGAYVPEHRLIASLGEGMLTLSNDHRCTIIGFGQFSATMSDRFRRDHDLREVTLFGSARLFHSADGVGIMCRHWDMPNTGFFKCKKDRLPRAYVQDDLVDWEFTLRHDRTTQGFYQLDND